MNLPEDEYLTARGNIKSEADELLRLQTIESDFEHFIGALMCEADGTMSLASRAMMEMALMRYWDFTLDESRDLIKKLFDKK